MIDARPELHLTPSTGWLNDANGLIQWKGTHHVFHQFDPDSFWFGRMQWGHFSSDDLVSWRRHPAALLPGDGPDRDGVWSGCVVDDGGTATAVYTGVVSRPDGSRIQTVCLATALDDGLIEWVPDAGNPMVVESPPVEVEAFRDPYVWKDDEGWWMLLGTGLPGGAGAVFLYRSADLREWRYEGIFASGDDLPASAPWTGTVWECPNLTVMPSGDAVLLISAHDPVTHSLHYTVALVGRVEGTRFVVSSAERFDHGHDCYAVAIENTDDGRVLGYGWAWDALSSLQREKQGWTGCMTLPRELGVEGGRLTLAPARELDAVTTPLSTLSTTTIVPGEPLEIAVPTIARVDASFRLDRTSVLHVALVGSRSTGEELTLDYSASRGSIVVDRSRSTTLSGVRGGQSTAAWELPLDGRFDVTWILDRSVVEVFVGGRIAFTERIHPQATDGQVVRIEARTEGFGEVTPAFTLDRLAVSQIAGSVN